MWNLPPPPRLISTVRSFSIHLDDTVKTKTVIDFEPSPTGGKNGQIRAKSAVGASGGGGPPARKSTSAIAEYTRTHPFVIFEEKKYENRVSLGLGVVEIRWSRSLFFLGFLGLLHDMTCFRK